MSSRGYPDYWKIITPEDCKEITKEHRNNVINIMRIFSNRLQKALKQDKENKEIQQVKLENLVEKVCWDVTKAIKDKDFEQDKKYEDFPHELSSICKNTFNELRNLLRKKRKSVKWEISTEQYKKLAINIFANKLKKLWDKHDKDKYIPENLEIYTHLLNNPWNKDLHKERKKIHNHSNTHHVEWFLECNEPKLEYLVEMVCDNVATAIARNAKYKDIFRENKERYIQKWLPENLATICANTFVDLWDTIHEDK